MQSLRWALLGILATVVGVATAHLAASLREIGSSPALAVGAAVIDLTPTPAKEWAIRTFGSNDKAVLVGSVLAAVLVLGGVAGLLARRRLWYGVGVLLVLVTVAAGAVLTRPSPSPWDLLPSLVAAGTAAGSLALLSRVSRGRGRETGGRRGVVVAVGLLTVLAVASVGAGRVVSMLRSRPEDVSLPEPARPAPPLPRGLDDQVPGITPFRTSNREFYRVDTRLDTPVLSAEGWTLTIDGAVERKVTLGYRDLLAMPLMERDITLTCVSNSVGGPYVGGARWLGVRLTDVLDLAGVRGGVDQILSTDFDGMTISTPFALATDGRDAMICVGMNGAPLPREHGFPLRMVIPGLYGFISATKWLTRLTLTSYTAQQAYWTRRDWATDAPIKIAARIDTPDALAELGPGEVVVGGIAWAQADGGVSRVQVRVDGGPWRDATLGPDGGNVYWRQWFFRWDAEPGSHSLAARAVSGDGQTQTAVRAEPFPEGASGIHELLVTVGSG